MANDSKRRTRREILDRLKTGGPTTAADLADGLGITAMAVRQHLYDLEAEELVTTSLSPRPVGRPAKLWGLTETAEKYFPDAHADLAVGLIDLVRDTLGPDALDRIVAQRSRQQADQYRTRLDGATGLRDRMEALARARTEEGYMAHVEDGPDGPLLIENHCPICSAAKTCTGLCAMELQVFQSVLGDDVIVERTDHILAGARRCAYRVTPKE
ncbi:MAG: transcriptional regulator [Alphaproteobacteria bacterium]